MDKAQLRWRKASDVDRESTIFELIDPDGDVLFDVGFSDANVFEIALGVKGCVLAWDDFQKLVADGRALAEHDK